MVLDNSIETQVFYLILMVIANNYMEVLFAAWKITWDTVEMFLRLTVSIYLIRNLYQKIYN